MNVRILTEQQILDFSLILKSEEKAKILVRNMLEM